MTGQQLKNSILQMAVQGKLVSQDPNDEPASVLVERIRKEKEKLIKEGKIKKEKNPSYIFLGEDNMPYEKIGNNEPVCIADEVPFEIPASWEWVRASSIGTMIRGNGIKRTETLNEGMPCVRYGELYTTYNIVFDETVSFISQELFEKCKHIKKDDILFTLTGENKTDIAKAVTYQGDGIIAAGGDLAYWTEHNMNPFYLVYYLMSPYTISRKRKTATGDIIVHISAEKIGKFLVPVPPIEEQKRIVSKIQKIEPLISKYDKHESTLSQLNDSFPESLKKSILQMAIQGKLVEQDENDAPASVLIDTIKAEKDALIKSGKLKKDKNESVIFRRDNSYYEKIGKDERCIDDEIPFDIPDSWEWCRWGSLSESIQYGYNAPAKDSGRIKMVRISDIQNNAVMWDTVPYCDIEEKNIETYLLKENDILFARTGGTVGKSYLVKKVPENAVYAGYLIRTRYSKLINSQYMKYFMESPLYWEQLRGGTIATAQPNCNGQTLSKMLVPIPSINEQNHIVDRVKHLMEYISKM